MNENNNENETCLNNNCDCENDICTDNCESFEKIKNENTPNSEINNIVNLEKEIENLKDSLIRKHADCENLRKRLTKEKDEVAKYSNWKFAQDLITTIDIFEQTMNSCEKIKEKINSDLEIKAIFSGITLCEKEFLSNLNKHGMNKIQPSLGENFDHKFHQAMMEIENSEYESGQITQIFQNGYIYNDRLLRPAMVCVSKK